MAESFAHSHRTSRWDLTSEEATVAKNQNTFEKRRREVEKRQRAEEKRKRRQQKKDQPPPPESGPRYGDPPRE
jgi:hypothetical protein